MKQIGVAGNTDDEHYRQDWDTYLAYGQESWERFSDQTGQKRQVGMNFMLNVAQLDPKVLAVSFMTPCCWFEFMG